MPFFLQQMPFQQHLEEKVEFQQNMQEYLYDLHSIVLFKKYEDIMNSSTFKVAIVWCA